MKFSGKAKFKSKWGIFNFVCGVTDEGLEHSILWIGDICSSHSPLLRIQSSCLTSTALGGVICDCAEQLTMSFEMIADEGRGAIVYLEQEGRGHGLYQKVETMCQMNQGMDTVDAFLTRGLEPDLRDFTDVGRILRFIEFPKKIRPITNNPAKLKHLEDDGFIIEKRVPIVVAERADIEGYMRAKKVKLGHLL